MRRMRVTTSESTSGGNVLSQKCEQARGQARRRLQKKTPPVQKRPHKSHWPTPVELIKIILQRSCTKMKMGSSNIDLRSVNALPLKVKGNRIFMTFRILYVMFYNS